ncbi:MAG: DUF4157 domain-containing protein, partial [Microcoleus sp. SIO2G3]|nr:DUF4157 domain-containing protein [Microcoleus sp. SIO2G3]
MTAQSQTTVKTEASSLLNTDKSGLLQRKCECGNAAGLTGECSECQSKVLTQPKRQTENSAAPVLHDLIQPKLTVGASNDRYEQEADRVATQILQMPEPQSTPIAIAPVNLQRQTLGIPEPETKRQEEEEETLQAKAQDGQTPQITPSLETQLHTSQEQGQPLTEPTRSFMESRFHHDFSAIRVHADAPAHRMAQELNAKAFTHQHHIYFSAGNYEPESPSGQQLLAHELTHTVQQGAAAPQPASQVQSDLVQRSSLPPDLIQKQPNGATVASDTAIGGTPAGNPFPTSSAPAAEAPAPLQNTPPAQDESNSRPPAIESTQVSSTPPQTPPVSDSPQVGSAPASQLQAEPDSAAIAPPVSEGIQDTGIPTPGTEQVGQPSATAPGTEVSFPVYEAFLTFVEQQKAASTEYFKTKKDALKQGIEDEGRKLKEAVQTEVQRLETTQRTVLEKINTSHQTAGDAIRAKRDTEIQAATDIAKAELERVDQVTEDKQTLMTARGEEKATQVLATGQQEVERTNIATETNVQQIYEIINQKSNQYSGQEDAADIAVVAREDAPNTAQEIRSAGNEIVTEVQEHAQGLAERYRGEANELATKFADPHQEAKDAIVQKRDETIAGLEEGSKQALDGLSEETSKLAREVTAATEQQLQALRQIPQDLDQELNDVLTLINRKVEESEQETQTDIEQFKQEVGKIFWYSDEVQAAREDLDKAIQAHHEDVAKYIETVLGKVGQIAVEFVTQLKAEQDQVIPALEKVHTSYQEAADQLETETIAQLQEVADESKTTTEQVATDLDAGLQETIDESDAKWNA